MNLNGYTDMENNMSDELTQDEIDKLSAFANEPTKAFTSEDILRFVTIGKKRHESFKTNKIENIKENDVNNIKEDSVLQEALNIVYKDRINQYGNPEDNFKVIASFWDTYLRSKYSIPDEIIKDKDVAIMMILFKVARESNNHKRDNLVDIIGYAECSNRLYGND